MVSIPDGTCGYYFVTMMDYTDVESEQTAAAP